MPQSTFSAPITDLLGTIRLGQGPSVAKSPLIGFRWRIGLTPSSAGAHLSYGISAEYNFGTMSATGTRPIDAAVSFFASHVEVRFRPYLGYTVDPFLSLGAGVARWWFDLLVNRENRPESITGAWTTAVRGAVGIGWRWSSFATLEVAATVDVLGPESALGVNEVFTDPQVMIGGSIGIRSDLSLSPSEQPQRTDGQTTKQRAESQ